ncbi:biopolymer transporter ExbD [Desulfuromonas acetoxidans]|uniref:Biopolymer transport protein ExbD/TolR n=1 Tax=Desulfuromonas acetoxidans (strain DSM 684 / 11070) TaxID=281689 RepID=Q1K022_DESA6|nr:biopolymer transporter ExbD [Desulfuromonas acetoxidans]EAT15720.1 Biopolymer transport protein ExbD/TolR [Desulfuromonas acetoxidans DSM 684]MBF0646644.1 biopolymer transporter ExbD [Desulfuromonas acetoxidans]NVD26089.1 biopolymer transporter ExbD [Desulfuromonas acetoxidans]NVE16921.1 biopolymer transporter ExbD [Desulfuromonas acetoxidans]
MARVSLSRRQRRKPAELNMSPLIDMIFILLIFFVVTTSFVREAGVDVQRPIAQTAETRDSTNMVLAITADNIVVIEGKPIDVRSVQSYMERFLMQNPNGSVVLAADRSSRSGLVIQVLDACRLAGVKNLSVAAKKGA